MQISIGTKSYSFTGEATPANIAQQISEEESGVNTKKLTEKLSKALFGVPYRKHDVIDPRCFADGALNINPKGFEKLLGTGASGGDSSALATMQPPKVQPKKRTPKSTTKSPPPPPPSVMAVAKVEGVKEQPPTGVSRSDVENNLVYARYVAPLLAELHSTTFELATPSVDSSLETGAYFNPKTNCVVLNSELPLATVMDNLIFELCNARHKAEFDAISGALSSKTLSPAQYGQAYAKTEFKTQMDHISILQKMHADGVPLSDGALKALEWVATVDESYFKTQDPSKLLKSFMTLPHNLKADSRELSSLPTPDMYTYSALEKMGGQEVFDRITRSVGSGKLPKEFSSWTRHGFPMKSSGYRRARAFDEVVAKAKELLAGDSKAQKSLESLELSQPLKAYAALRGGLAAMPSYPR